MNKTPRGSLSALFSGNFVVGTGTLVIAGMLNILAEDLQTPVAAIGQLIAGYALASCFGAPLLAAMTSHIDRRRLLVAALALFAAGHLLAAFAPGYTVLLILRVIVGFGAAIFTPQAAATAGLLAPADRRGRAVALVFLGWSVASVLGNPLGIFIGAAFGWRASLALIGLVAAVSAVLVHARLPEGLYVQRMDRAAWGRVLRDTALLLVLATTVLQFVGQYTLAVYMAAAFKEYLAAGPGMIAFLFGWFGFWGVAGNLMVGLFIDRIGAGRVVKITMGLILAGLLLWPLTRESLPMTMLALALWGLGSFATNGSQQARLIALAPSVSSVSVALNTSGFYLGQAAGAMIGGLVLVSIGMDALSWVAAGILLVAFGASFVAQLTLTVAPRATA